MSLSLDFFFESHHDDAIFARDDPKMSTMAETRLTCRFKPFRFEITANYRKKKSPSERAFTKQIQSLRINRELVGWFRRARLIVEENSHGFNEFGAVCLSLWSKSTARRLISFIKIYDLQRVFAFCFCLK